jgi:hypothetical protein
MDAARFPSIRTARELYDARQGLLGLGITVSASCLTSPSVVYLPGYVLTLISQGTGVATCADVPGATDFVLTAEDIAAVNARMAQMNAHIALEATQNGYAYFSLGALYDLGKPVLDVAALLLSETPFGVNISLDGVHPSARGQGLLADAAVQAINAKYGVAIR